MSTCGAKTKTGPCDRPPEPGKARCRLHGGAPGSGAPPGERNGAYRHGRFSAEKRAQRRAEALEAHAKRRAAEQAWMAAMPKTDYAAICDAIRASKRRNDQ